MLINQFCWEMISLLNNQTSLNEATLIAKSTLALDKDKKRITASSINAKKIVINDTIQLTNSLMYAEQHLKLLPAATLDAVSVHLQSAGAITLFGNAVLNHSNLRANALKVYGDVDLAQCDVFLLDEAIIKATGTIHSVDTHISSNTFTSLNTMNAKNTALTAKETINFSHASKTKAINLLLKAEHAINISALSELLGQEVQMKANTLCHQGVLDVNKLDIDVDILHNNQGEIDGGDSLHLIADKLLYNFLGTIHARQLTINTGVSLNVIGDIKGQDNLNLNALVDVNLYGAQRSFSMNLNNLVSLNTGLILPAIPSSPAAILTPQNIFAITRVLLTNLVPSLRNTINIVSHTAPVLWKIGSTIYDLATHPKKSWRDLLPKITLNKPRITDFLSMLLSLKNIGMGGKSVYETFAELPSDSEPCSFATIENDFKTISPYPLINEISSVICPNMQHNSVFSANMGIIGSQNILQNTFAHFNGGIVTGWQSMSVNDYIFANQGVIAADQITLSNESIENTGLLMNSGKMILKANQLKNSGQLDAKHASLTVDTINNLGSISLSDGTLLSESLNHLGNIHIHGPVLMRGAHTVNLNQSIITGDGQLCLSGNEINIDNGMIQTDGLLLEDPTFKQVDDLFSCNNTFKKIHANDLGFITKQSITIDKVINRQGNIFMEAPSVQVNAAVNSAGNLAIITTQNDLITKANLCGQQHLFLQAMQGNINLDHHDYSSHGIVAILAHQNILNHGGQIHGNDTYLTAEEGSIKNISGTITADTYLQIIAQHDVVNEASSSFAWGGYDYYKLYKRGEMIGGQGDGVSPGLYIKAGNTIINDTSTLGAKGKVYLEGTHAVTAKPSTHQYISYQHTQRHRFGKKTSTTVIDTQIEKPQIFSSNDQIIIKSEEGSIQTTGTDIIAKKGADLYAKGNIILYDVKGFHSFNKNKTGYLGLSHDNHYESHDTSTPTVLASIDPAVLRIHSAESDIVIKGSYLYNPLSEIIMMAKNINIIPTILQSYFLDKQDGWQLKLGNCTLINMQPSSSPLFHPDPLWSDVIRLENNRGGTDGLFNTAQVSLDLVNTSNAVSSAMNNGTLLQLFAARQGLFSVPLASITRYSKTTETYIESLATGKIVAGDLILTAENNITIEGVPVYVSNNMNVQAKEFIEKGVTLQQNTKQTANEWTVSSSQGPMPVDVSMMRSNQSINSTETAPQILKVDKTLNIDVEQWEINNSEVLVEQLVGKADHLSITGTVDSTKMKASSYHASTTGDVGFTRESNKQEFINHAGTLIVNHPDNNQFTTESITLVDGHLQSSSGERLDLHPRKLTISHQVIKNESHQQGFSCNFFNPIPRVKKQILIQDSELLKRAYQFSDSVYMDNLIGENELSGGFSLVGQLKDKKTGSVVAIYLNNEENTVFFAFRGTADLASVITDDLDIALGKTLHSEQSAMWQETLNQITAYREEGYSVYLTGHSRGASQACLASSDTKTPAIVFDNPGIYDPNHQYDLSQVISVQSTSNFINHVGEATGKFYNQGEIIQLNPTVVDQVIQLSGAVVENQTAYVAPKLIYGIGQTFWSHSLSQIASRMPGQVTSNLDF